MSVRLTVHNLSRGVFDTLPGTVHESEQGDAWWKVVRLTDEFEITVFTWEPADHGLQRSGNAVYLAERAVEDRVDKQAQDDRDDEREPAGEEA